MCKCSRCKKPYPEHELTWIELPKIYHMQVKPSMEVVCDNCLKKEKLNNQGYTLTELLVTMSIITILVSLLLTSMANTKSLAQQVACHNYSRQLKIYWFASSEDENYYSKAFEELGLNAYIQPRRLSNKCYDCHASR